MKTLEMKTRRVILALAIGTLLCVAAQILSGLFYAWRFEDLVRDEVRFAPVREKTEKSHLVDHIVEAARDCHIELDQHNVQVVRTRDIQRAVNTLTIDVAYSVPVRIFTVTHELQRHIESSVTY